MTHRVQLNINQTVLLNLTELGVRIWRAKYDKFPELDASGYLRTQLWTVITVFGEHIYLGMPTQPFVSDIVIEYDVAPESVCREPLRMLLTCPACGQRHVDAAPWDTRPHHTHACQSCGMVWRPALEPTVGVRFLPGFRDEVPAT